MHYVKHLIILIALLAIALLSCTHPTNELVKKNEKYYNHVYCQKEGGKEEMELKNKVRVDCLTDEFAIEMDWANKWYEGITQALYYGMETEKKAKLVLIIESKGDTKYFNRAYETIKYYKLPITLSSINN